MASSRHVSRFLFTLEFLYVLLTVPTQITTLLEARVSLRRRSGYPRITFLDT
jgi:hypothetical protein